ncbi:MAG: hypothetical protein LBG27_08860 [Spirochaetaceae bacterium]|jgi:tetratricopeptide (TPR) repeat protein|nr:hypothetical protein [Spirochaetaceae bacterium]
MELENLILNRVSTLATVQGAICAVCTLPVLMTNSTPERRIKKLTRKIKRNPNKASLYLERGNVFVSLHYFDEASKDYNKSFELDPKNEEVAKKRLDAIEKWLKTP